GGVRGQVRAVAAPDADLAAGRARPGRAARAGLVEAAVVADLPAEAGGDVDDPVVADPLVEAGVPVDDGVDAPVGEVPLQRRVRPVVHARAVHRLVERDHLPGGVGGVQGVLEPGLLDRGGHRGGAPLGLHGDRLAVDHEQVDVAEDDV